MRSARLRSGSGVSRTCGAISQCLFPDSVFHLHHIRESGTHVLHDANSLLGLGDKVILGLLNLLLRLRAQLLLLVSLSLGRAGDLPGRALDAGLDGIEGQARLLDVLARAGGELEVGVEGRVPPGQEAALDLGVLGQAGLAHPLHRERVLLQRRGQRVLPGARVLLVQGLAARQAGAGDRVRERLGLRLRGRGRGQGGLGLGGGCGGGEKGDLLADGSAQVLEGLLDIGRVVVGLVRVLRSAPRQAGFSNL